MNAPTCTSKYTFAARDDIDFHDAWRPLDRAVACWVRAHGGSRELARVAAWASLAEGRGHSALALSGDTDAGIGMASLDAAQRRELAADALVAVAPFDAAPPRERPFVIDGEHFFLCRNFLHETAAAAHIARRLATPAGASPDPSVWIDDLFGNETIDGDRAQRDAVARASGRRLFVLTGGPGTGKTTTVLRMLMILVRNWQAHTPATLPTLRVAAPTGKAAQRIAQALHDGAQRLRAAVAPGSAWQAALEHAGGAPTSTVHRLLGSRGTRGGFTHHRGNPLRADIVVVDEASMLDLSLLRHLLDALREDALLVLVGDADQLTSVGSGSVLRDITNALDGTPDLVRLSHSFRADPVLVPLNDAVRRGDVAAFRAARDASGGRIELLQLDSSAGLRQQVVRWSHTLRDRLDALGAFAAVDDPVLALAILAGMRERQLLCALREGEWGADAVAALLERALRDRLARPNAGLWYPGRAVMIAANDASSGLYNGDVGICLADREGRLRVWFEIDAQRAVVGGAASRRAVAFAPGSLPAQQCAFALTIHKSQGSEYGHVAVLMPDAVDSRVLSRELLYTGISRARDSVEIWGRVEVIERALATPVRRSGLLEQRLRGK
ncbi:MAG: exodeoxyribonuclease V subunit alpha [Rudaea sp.]